MKKEEGGLSGLIKSIDFYKDLPKGLAQPTYVGASLSTGFLILMGSLLFYQVTEYLSYQKTSEMLIDSLQEDQFVSRALSCHSPRPCAPSSPSTSISPCPRRPAPFSPSTSWT